MVHAIVMTSVQMLMILDTDEDTVVDCIDECPYDFENDADDDGVCGDVDECPGFDDNIDTDADGVANGCDECPLDTDDDSDGDGSCILISALVKMTF